MSSFLQCICCCCYEEQETPTRQKPNKKNVVKKQKQNRLITKYKSHQFVLVDEQSRRNGNIKAYCCPICTLYYTKIIACSQCVNFICYSCLEGYYKKNQQNQTKMKCPFCSSVTTIFIDYQLEPHSYFDKTGGFLSKQQRTRLDVQMKRREQEVQRSQQQLQMVQQNANREQPLQSQ